MREIYSDGQRFIERKGQPTAGGAYTRYLVFEKKSMLHGERRKLQGLLFQHNTVSEVGVTGITNECLLAIVKDRLECFQAGPFPCKENQEALGAVNCALEALQFRTKDRQKRGVEGKHEE